MEGGVEYSHLRHILAQQVASGDDSLNIIGVVQGSKIDAVLDSLEDAIIDQSGFFEQLSAVHHAMADGMHVSAALDLGNARSIRCQEPY